MLRLPTRRGGTISLFTLVAMVIVPITVIIGIATADLGHELTWFGRLSQAESAWMRYGLVAASIAFIVCAFLSRRHRRET